MLTETDYLPLRPMLEDDVAAVMAVEERAYEVSWTDGIFRDCLKHGHSCWIYEQDGQVVGYAVLMFVLDEMHILNICIDPVWQGQRLGSRLLATVERIGQGAKAQSCFLEVRQSNYTAQRLYLQAGFNEIGLRKDYYRTLHGREDAIVMAKTFL